MEDKNFNYEESLQLINTMIHKAKNSYRDTGVGAMLWGAVIAICSLELLSERYFNYRLPFDIYLLALFAIIPQVIITSRESRQRKVKSYNDNFLKYIWLAFGISIFLLIHALNLTYMGMAPMIQEYKTLTGRAPVFIYREFTSSFFLILYGIPTFITGAGCKFKPMIWGGLICWVCSIITVYTSYNIDLLLTAFSAITAWFIPGLLMKREYTAAKKREALAHV